MIKCPECKIDVSESAAACPSCGHPVAKTVTAAEKKKGCGGCLVILGILILIAGFGTFLFARKSAGDLVQTNYENRGIEGVAADDALAKAAGLGSYSDYLTKQNRDSGLFFVCVGVGLGIVGYRMYNAKNAKKD